jgi:hypothetical protein
MLSRHHCERRRVSPWHVPACIYVCIDRQTCTISMRKVLLCMLLVTYAGSRLRFTRIFCHACMYVHTRIHACMYVHTRIHDEYNHSYSYNERVYCLTQIFSLVHVRVDDVNIEMLAEEAGAAPSKVWSSSACACAWIYIQLCPETKIDTKLSPFIYVHAHRASAAPSKVWSSTCACTWIKYSDVLWQEKFIPSCLCLYVIFMRMCMNKI